MAHLIPMTTYQSNDPHKTGEFAVFSLNRIPTKEEMDNLQQECDNAGLFMEMEDVNNRDIVRFFAPGETQHNGCWDVVTPILTRLGFKWTMLSPFRCELCYTTGTR